MYERETLQHSQEESSWHWNPTTCAAWGQDAGLIRYLEMGKHWGSCMVAVITIPIALSLFLVSHTSWSFSKIHGINGQQGLLTKGWINLSKIHLHAYCNTSYLCRLHFGACSSRGWAVVQRLEVFCRPYNSLPYFHGLCVWTTGRKNDTTRQRDIVRLTSW